MKYCCPNYNLKITRFSNSHSVQIHAIFHVQFQSNFNDFKHCSTFLLFFCSSGYYYLLLHFVSMTCFKILHVWRIACLSKNLFLFLFRYCLMMSFWSNLNRNFFCRSNLYLWKKCTLKWSLTLKYSKPLSLRIAYKKVFDIISTLDVSRI